VPFSGWKGRQRRRAAALPAHAKQTLVPADPGTSELAHAAIARLRSEEPALNLINCVWCDNLRAANDNVLDFIARASPDELRGNTFCVRHLPPSLSVLSKETARAVLEGEARELTRFWQDCREYFRKTDYRYKGEPKGIEQQAWLRAAELLCSTPQREALHVS